MIKFLRNDDVQNTPFVATKEKNFNHVSYDYLYWRSGSIASGSILINSAIYPTSSNTSLLLHTPPTQSIILLSEGVKLSGNFNSESAARNVDGTYKEVVHSTYRHMFYNLYGDPTRIFGEEVLDSDRVNRVNSDTISVFSIPISGFGEKIQPHSVTIYDSNGESRFKIVDDGYNNLYISSSAFTKTQVEKTGSNSVISGSGLEGLSFLISH